MILIDEVRIHCCTSITIKAFPLRSFDGNVQFHFTYEDAYCTRATNGRSQLVAAPLRNQAKMQI